MLIPKYWAQHKQLFESMVDSNTGRTKAKKQATIKRYGWSDVSQSDALTHAKVRVNEAYKQWLAGDDIMRRERIEQYNDSNGIPIREQSITEQNFFTDNSTTQLIKTRNSYGAHVANVDNIAIIDVDNEDLLNCTQPTALEGRLQASMKPHVWGFVIASIVIASIIASLKIAWFWLILFMIPMVALLWRKAAKNERMQQHANAQKLAELSSLMTKQLQQRVANYPKESFRLYQTPAGFRLIATHDTVLPNDDVVGQWFAYFHADANYVRLCQMQQCFRARLTAKPWRMSEVTEQHILTKTIPRHDFFLMNDVDDGLHHDSMDEMDDEQYAEFARQQANIAKRQQWIADYDTFAKNYKACRYLDRFGSPKSEDSTTQKAINEFVEWHDKACQVDKDLPMA